MNYFGGDWTKTKIEILVEYAKAYLNIMNDRKFFKLLYFDGFAGSGFIIKDKKIDVDITVGAAKRIIEIEEPRPFDLYYFVELDPINYKQLLKNTKETYPNKNIHTVPDDCNKKIIDLSVFLRKKENKNYRTLAYIDPCGMQVEWKALESLKDLPIDVWILVPTGMGVNRLLKKDGQISDAWLDKLEKFLGLNKIEIKDRFYTKTETLFPDITITTKEEDAINKSAKLYQERLRDIFNHVSEPYEMKNSTNSVMYHLYLASNNKTAIKIGNDIVRKYNG
jgi:three-Cys-motif partner protein